MGSENQDHAGILLILGIEFQSDFYISIKFSRGNKLIAIYAVPTAISNILLCIYQLSVAYD